MTALRDRPIGRRYEASSYRIALFAYLIVSMQAQADQTHSRTMLFRDFGICAAGIFSAFDILNKAKFLERLVAIVPPPNKNMIRYSGEFASNSRLRKQIIPKPQDDASQEPEFSKHPATKKHWSWAKLMRRVFEVDVRECPRCKSQMQTISFITEGRVIRDILASLRMATAPPEPHPSHYKNEQDDFFSDVEYDYSQETWA